MTTPRAVQATVADDEPISVAIAGRVIDGISAFDFDAVAAVMTEDVRFRALLPGRVVEVEGPEAVRDVFRTWFGGATHWEMVEAVVGEVGGRVHFRWQIRLTNPGRGPGSFVVEQLVYADPAVDGRLRDVSLLCSGYRKVH